MQQLNSEDINNVSGGFWGKVLIAIAVYDAATDFIKGFNEGINAN
jgi:hypothetical protein